MAISISDIKQVQNNQNLVIADQIVSVLKNKDELHSIGGVDDYVVYLRQIVTAYPQGIALTTVQTALTDPKSLGEARNVLKASGELEETPSKKSFILKLKATVAAE